MTANTTPSVFHYFETNQPAKLAAELLASPVANVSAVMGALPYLGHRALTSYELVIRQVADTIAPPEMMTLLAAYETEAAKPEPVSKAALDGLARTYFARTGRKLSLTRAEPQAWQIPGTTLQMSAQRARDLALEVAAEAKPAVLA